MKSKKYKDLWLYEFNDDKVSFCDLHFYHIDDIENLVEEFINDNFLAKQKVIAFIHGYGTGKLKNKVHEILKKHPLVEYYWLGSYKANSNAITYVILNI